MLQISATSELTRAQSAPGRCGECEVRTSGICGSLAIPDLEQLSSLGRIVRLAPGQALLWEGSEAVLVGNVIEGTLKLSTVTGDGREQIVGIVFASDFIGRPFGKDSSQTVTALTPATICVFSRTAFDRYADEHPGIESALLRRTLDELDRARRWLMLLGRLSATERVASLLVELVDRSNVPEDQSIILPLSRQQMGDLLGLAIETVSRTMTKLQRAGLIGLPGGRRLQVVDRDALARVAAGWLLTWRNAQPAPTREMASK